MATRTVPLRDRNTKTVRDFGRAAGGALIFSLPLLMTAELWSLGFYLDRARLLVLLLASLPLLVVLSRHIGFERTRRWRDDILDSMIALGLLGLICAALLVLFGTITPETPLDEAVGKIAIQMVPGSMGALLAKSQFGAGGRDDDDDDGTPGERDEPYAGELFLMGVGALFLGFNIAPTDDLMLISFRMEEWHALVLMALSLTLMHGFVYAVGFAGGSETSPAEPWWSGFVRLTLPGYALALTMSLFLLWIFARTDGLDLHGIVMATVVLAFPSAIGAAAARLIL